VECRDQFWIDRSDIDRLSSVLSGPVGLDGPIAKHDEALTVRTHHRAAAGEFSHKDHGVAARTRW